MFIEVTDGQFKSIESRKKRLINKDWIAKVEEEADGTALITLGCDTTCIFTSESYAEIRDMLADRFILEDNGKLTRID